jgi:hypothetical protein
MSRSWHRRSGVSGSRKTSKMRRGVRMSRWYGDDLMDHLNCLF